MSYTYTLVCHELKIGIWVGQGWDRMTNFYSGMPEKMEKLGRFLEATRGKSLELVCDETSNIEYDEFEGEDEG